MSTLVWNKIVETYIYDKDSTINNAYAKKYPDTLIPYNELCRAEGSKAKNLSNELVIYLDKIAEKECPYENLSTMDFAHGIAYRKNTPTEKTKGLKIILTECRFNYRKVINISKDDLQKK